MVRGRRYAQYQRQLSASELISQLDLQSMLLDAPVTSVRQTIEVERLEDEIVSGPTAFFAVTPALTLGVGHSDMISASISDYDTVSEQVCSFLSLCFVGLILIYLRAFRARRSLL